MRLDKSLPHGWMLILVIPLLAVLLIWMAPQAAAEHYPAWQAWQSYAVGDLVSYEGAHYRALQAHTSQPGWEPPHTPALWEGLTGDGPTATPAPDESQTPTPSPAPTQQPGNCPYPAWQAAEVYHGGDQVAHGGHRWEARWWTQGEEPGTTGEWGVWRDHGPCGDSPTPAPTATATATPSEPVPTPTSSATPSDPGGGDLPRRLIVGYWHNFDNGSTALKLREVNLKYDIINVAFAEPTTPGGSTMAFAPYNASQEEFRSDIAYLKSRGKKILISIGGANGAVDLSSPDARQNFASSMMAIIEAYGFDGMDIDLEGNSLYLSGGDSDFRNPTSPKITNLIGATQDILNHFGPNFILTMAPETAYVQGGLGNYGGVWGAYLPVIYAFRDRLTVLHVQHYNSGSMEALDGQSYSQGTADFHVAMAEMLLQGFPVARNESHRFPALRPEQVAIGLPATSSAAGGGYTSPAEVQRALDYLIKGQSFGGRYQLRNTSGYPTFRGVMTWSINWDATNSYQFANSHRSYLDGLPR